MVRFSVHKLHIVLLFAIVLLAAAAALSAQPFSRILSFQGRLADVDTGKPLADGQYEVTFTIYDAETEGNVLWQEVQEVAQTGGVVNVHLGSVTPFPPKLFALSDRWLSIQVDTDPEMAERFQFTPSPWAMFAGEICLPYQASVQSAPPAVWVENEGQGEAFFGRNVPSGNFGYVGGTQAAVYGEGPDGSFGALAVMEQGSKGSPSGDLPPPTIGVHGVGTNVGGLFENLTGSGLAYVADGDYGIWTYGDASGGFFWDSSASGYSLVGDGDNGITSGGNAAGGYFEDSDSSGYAYVGVGDYGISAHGNDVGGYFNDIGQAYAFVAYGDNGIWAFGTDVGDGGYFYNTDHGNPVHLATPFQAGHFENTDSGTRRTVTLADQTRAGYFENTFSGTEVFLAGQTRAGYFVGDVHITGNLSKGSGTFKIDHPLDPENMYLSHSFVESPDMMNVYNGNVILDDSGGAWIELPEWFEVLNRDFRYQLTCIGGFAPVYIAEEIADNCFKIAGGEPGLKVSWQVTGIRCDAYAEAHPVVVEQEKPQHERGTYLHPELYGTAGAGDLDSVPRGR